MGLTASIFHNPLGNCSNNGISAKFDRCCIVNADGPFEPDADTPAVMIVKGAVPGALKVVPAIRVGDEWDAQAGWFMMGGDYIACSDSRYGECARRVYEEAWGRPPFPHLQGVPHGALPFHDRQE